MHEGGGTETVGCVDFAGFVDDYTDGVGGAGAADFFQPFGGVRGGGVGDGYE